MDPFSDFQKVTNRPICHRVFAEFATYSSLQGVVFPMCSGDSERNLNCRRQPVSANGAIDLVPEYHACNRKNHMQPDTTKKLFTVDEYYQMAEAGILGPGDRVELIDGEIIQMSPIGSRHAAHVTRADR